MRWMVLVLVLLLSMNLALASYDLFDEEFSATFDSLEGFTHGGFTGSDGQAHLYYSGVFTYHATQNGLLSIYSGGEMEPILFQGHHVYVSQDGSLMYDDGDLHSISGYDNLFPTSDNMGSFPSSEPVTVDPITSEEQPEVTSGTAGDSSSPSTTQITQGENHYKNYFSWVQDGVQHQLFIPPQAQNNYDNIELQLSEFWSDSGNDLRTFLQMVGDNGVYVTSIQDSSVKMHSVTNNGNYVISTMGANGKFSDHVVFHGGHEYRVLPGGEIKRADGTKLTDAEKESITDLWNEEIKPHVDEVEVSDRERQLALTIEINQKKSLVLQWSDMLAATSASARDFSGYSSLFMGKNELASWRESRDQFFADHYLGTQYWASAICVGKLDVPNEQVAFYTHPSTGQTRLTARVSGERLTAISDEFGDLHLYKLEFYAVNPQSDFHDEMCVRVFLQPGDVELFDKPFCLEPGETISRAGTSALVQYSSNEYDRICLKMSGAPRLVGATGSDFCDKIVKKDIVPTTLPEPTATGGDTGDQGPQAQPQLQDF